MPKVNIAKKSTDTDMTPFVDIAFLILSFFIMATKFKPAEAVPIQTPNSVSSQKLPENDAVMISIDKDDKVYFSIMAQKDPQQARDIIKAAAQARNIPVTDAQVAGYFPGDMIGVPFNKLGAFLALPADQKKTYVQEGIPVKDSANNELYYWIAASRSIFAGQPLKYLIKGDNVSKYPAFKAIIDALKKNDEQKYNLVTMPEGAPTGTELWVERNSK
ncbi:biopolymer transporter ExbD [Niabella yanshanensis]|uniref:Biopolymer transporter ExbD n=1 Tax=Niabella yanshanensis TaxID=577386 RepID=A0ABZ0W3U0_9BACT|nr:biopolymer transporter ExbD [Niabella yanshanensis]WQD37214.1 biopolymer transporter ExbD [Niabella yanshanensis]